ncbi:MAG: hypothetical protein L0226_01240, partial [Acidobacteria bacterium]|nr:hypothetical protein [Acidobacteriota bacterium]
TKRAKRAKKAKGPRIFVFFALFAFFVFQFHSRKEPCFVKVSRHQRETIKILGEYETNENNETNEKGSNFFVCFVIFVCFVLSLLPPSKVLKCKNGCPPER